MTKTAKVGDPPDRTSVEEFTRLTRDDNFIVAVRVINVLGFKAVVELAGDDSIALYAEEK